MANQKSITAFLRSSTYRTFFLALGAFLVLIGLSLTTASTPSAFETLRDHAAQQQVVVSGLAWAFPSADSSYAIADLVAPNAHAAGLTYEEAQEMCTNLWMKDWLGSCFQFECNGQCTSEQYNSCMDRAFNLYKGCMKSAGFALRSSPGGT